MEFLADNMLGRLARWLRILGYDAIYSKKGIGQFEIKKALSEHRTILTRNSRLLKKSHSLFASSNYESQEGDMNIETHSNRVLFISNDNWIQQVRQVIREFGLEFNKDIFLTRCGDCNNKLILLSKEKVKRKIPDYVFQTQCNFHGCSKCKRIYWQGTHYFQMEKLIESFWQKEDK